MKFKVLAASCATAFIGIMSAFVVLQPVPEQTFAASDDGVVTVSGVARTAQHIDVVTGAAVTGSVLHGSAYTLAGEGVLDVPMTLTFRTDDVATAYRFNEERAMWEELENARYNDGLLTVQATARGAYALGKGEDVAVPTFFDEYAALRTMAPEGAVGYTIAVAYARDSEPFVRLFGEGEQGGCGGAVLPGEQEAQSVRERRATLLVDDVQTTVTMLFLATWQVNETGCGQLSPFLPASEHATLPVSS